MKSFTQHLNESNEYGRVQVHYDSVDGYNKPIKVIATVPPVTEKPLDNKYDLMRYIEKYIKEMKSKGVIKGKYEIVYPHDTKWRKPATVRPMGEEVGNILYIVRGLPGSGKSTYAKTLVHPSAHFEADQYFMKGGKYVFDPSKLKDAHADCLARTRKAMMGGKHKAVAVSNTFTMKWEVEPYLKLAEELGWTPRIIRMTGNYGSIHDVPQDSIERMRSRFEPIGGETRK